MDQKDWDQFSKLIEKIVNTGNLNWMEKRDRIVKELKEREGLDDFSEVITWFDEYEFEKL